MTCGVVLVNMAEGGSTLEEPLGMRAVLIGATGAIGECLLGELLTSKAIMCTSVAWNDASKWTVIKYFMKAGVLDLEGNMAHAVESLETAVGCLDPPHISKVVSLGRRNATVPAAYSVDQKAEEDSGRLEQHVVDFENISTETVGKQFKDKDVFFCTLGTTRRAAGSAAAFRHVDYDYVMNCAKVAKEANVPHVLYVSSQGAKASSWVLYFKVKAQVEESLKEMQFPKASIFRPGLLDRGDKKRFVEKVYGWVAAPILVSKVAKGLVIEAVNFAKTKKTDSNQQQTSITYENNDILTLLSTN